MKIRLMLLFTAICVMVCFNSCKDDDAPAEETLYEKLGGETMVDDPTGTAQIEQGRLGLRSVVDSTIFVIAADPSLSPFFATLLAELGNSNTSNLALLSKNLTDFFCVATGSKNFTYSGLNMKDSHDPAINSRMAMKATDADFDDFIGAVVTGATQNNVPTALITEVGALLETLRADVVQQ